MESVEEAVQEYLEVEKSDRQGILLLTEAEELLNSGMSEEELARLIESTWLSRADSRGFEFAYKDVLAQIVRLLRAQGHTKS